VTAAKDLYRQALTLPMEERRELVELIAASISDDASDLDPSEVAAALRELEDHRRDPSGALSSEDARAWLAARRASR
jgi:hypothetical protein